MSEATRVPPRREFPAERRQISEAMIDLVLERGYEGTTLAVLIDRAGVEQADFDRHFEGLEDCFVETFWSNVVEVFERRVFGAYEAHDTWREGLRASAYEVIRFIREHPRESRFGSIEMMHLGPVAQAYRERQLQHLVDLIDEGRGELEDPGSVTRTAAEAALGSVYMAVVDAVRQEDQETVAVLEAQLPHLMYLAVRPYLGESVAREELSIPVPPLARSEEGA